VNGQREDFFIDLKKLQQLQEKRGINDSRLSEAIGKSRSWFCSLKKKAEPKIDISQANLIANLLNCAIQDFGDESKNKLFNPVVFDYEEDAKRLFNELLPQNAELITAFLRFLKLADIEQKRTLRVYVSNLKHNKNQGLFPLDDQWWKALFISNFIPKLSDFLLKNLELCSASNLFDDYNKAVKKEMSKERKRKWQELIQAGKSQSEAMKESKQLYLNVYKRYDLMKGIVYRITSKSLRKLTDDADTENKILNDTSETCAKFLVSYAAKTTPDYELMVDRYKQGNLDTPH